MAILKNTPFRSEYGFESAGFVVDNEGNIIAKSITLAEELEQPSDIIIEEVEKV